MARKRMTLLDSAARTASGVGAVISSGADGDNFRNGLFLLDVTAVGGTLPTLKVYVLGELPDGTFSDLAAFAQVAGIDKRALLVTAPAPGGFVEGAVLSQSIGLASARNLPLPPNYRLAWVIGGSLASFTFSVTADLYY